MSKIEVGDKIQCPICDYITTKGHKNYTCAACGKTDHSNFKPVRKRPSRPAMGPEHTQRG